MTMKRRFYILAILCPALFAMPVVVHADEDDSDAFGARVSAEAEFSLMKGMDLSVSEELRFFGGDSFFDRSYSQVGLSYRFCDYFKAGVSYTAIAVNKDKILLTEAGEDSVNWTEWRHRVSADLIGSVRAGQWKFSLRERFQGTYRMSELNNYQQPQMGWVLRSRLKVAYEFRSVPLEPYAYFEPRLALNGAKWSEESLGGNYKDAEFLGHKDVYVSRYRGAAGLEWQLDRRSSIDFYVLYDSVYDKEIDARKEGSKKGVQLKAPITGVSSDRISVGIGYKYSF